MLKNSQASVPFQLINFLWSDIGHFEDHLTILLLLDSPSNSCEFHIRSIQSCLCTPENTFGEYIYKMPYLFLLKDFNWSMEQTFCQSRFFNTSSLHRLRPLNIGCFEFNWLLKHFSYRIQTIFPYFYLTYAFKQVIKHDFYSFMSQKSIIVPKNVSFYISHGFILLQMMQS